MLKTYPAEVENGAIKLSEKASLPDGAKVLVTILDESDADFWRAASAGALDSVWDNNDDDVYAELLKS